MNRFWNVIEASIEAVEPRLVVEVGVEAGATTRMLLERLGPSGAVLHAIDPAPGLDPERLVAEHPGRLVFHRDRSLSALGRVGAPDLVLLDGDHNWYTVLHELELLERAAARHEDGFPLVLLHDVDWPYGRRDLYYEPEAIPPAHRQAHRRLGLLPDRSDPVPDGGLNPHLENALYENDLRNGVRTAVEDFVASSELELELVDVPGFHGLGVLVPGDRLRKSSVKGLVSRLRSAAFLREQVHAVERARVQTEIKRAAERQQEERVETAIERGRQLQAEQERLEQELAEARAREEQADGARERLEQELVAERARAEVAGDLREQLDQRLAQEAARVEEAGRAREQAERNLAERADELSRARLGMDEARERVAEIEDEQRRRLEHAFRLRSEEIKAAAAERVRLQRRIRKAQKDLAAADEELKRRRADEERARTELASERERAATQRRQLRGVAREVSRARDDIARASSSRSWRLGHGLAGLARRVTFRRPMGEGALARATVRLEHAGAELESARGEDEGAGGQPAAESATPAAVEASYAELERRTREALPRRYRQELGLVQSDPDPLASGELEVPLDSRGILTPAENQGWPSVSVVVCVHDALGHVRECLRSLLSVTARPFHLILVDDGSGPETASHLRRFADRHPSVTLIRRDEAPHGYSIAANLGMRASNADWTLLLNSDTVVTPGWLDAIIACAESDPAIGVVGPLSNAASHQSVPAVRENGGWAVNALPDFVTPDGMAFLVDRASERRLPRFPFINGFCYAISRAALSAVGYFDEERFGGGYCEENDFSHRARQAGFELALADDSYVFHAKSRSYSDAGRAAIFQQSYQRFLAKHGAEEIEGHVSALESDRSLGSLRTRLQKLTDGPEALRAEFTDLCPEPLRICFLLGGMPPGGSGGVHSVYQEARGLTQLGTESFVALPESAMETARRTYPDGLETFRGYSSDQQLIDLAAGVDVLVATHYKTVAVVKRLLDAGVRALPAYYVQDFEPLFADEGSADAQEALASYSTIPGQVLFAKTRWLCDLVGRATGVHVAKVEASLDRTVYHRRGRSDSRGPLRLAAMIRPRTPRRQPLLALDCLRLLAQDLGDRIEIRTFGCDAGDLSRLGAADVPLDHRGELTREQVAELLRDSDVFLDASVYQGFGRTGLEAMACGCVPVLPAWGGVHEFGRDEETALLVDTSSADGPVGAVARLSRDDGLLERLREGAVTASERFSVTRAALSEYVLLEHAWTREHAGRRGQGDQSTTGRVARA